MSMGIVVKLNQITQQIYIQQSNKEHTAKINKIVKEWQPKCLKFLVGKNGK